jgi:hypothetical protein
MFFYKDLPEMMNNAREYGNYLRTKPAFFQHRHHSGRLGGKGIPSA